MSANGRKPQESPKGAPAYIVTFSDMITLLLTFFVLLLSIADNRDKGLFQRGQNSFKRAIADFGMSGIIFSKNDGKQFNHPRVKYKIDKGEDKKEDRSIDSATEVYRRIIQEVEKTMKISPSQITCSSNDFTVTDIRFAPGSWKLNDEGRQFIDGFVTRIRDSYVDAPPAFYVVGLGASEKTAKDQWLISARRAQTVAERMKALSPGWVVYSWGAGAGGDWTGETGILSKKTDIMIAVLADGV